jgi:hypothetical protein
MAGVTVAIVCMVALASPVIADPLGTATAQEAMVAAQIQAGAARIRALTVAYDQDNLRANALAQQVSDDQARLQALQAQVSGDLGVLRYDAILSYTGGAGSVAGRSGGSAPAAGVGASVNDPSVRAEYLEVAVGDITEAVDQYRASERAVAVAEANLATQEKAANVALAAAGAERQAALNQAAAEQAQLAALQVNVAQLTEAIAAAARQRTAQAARAAEAARVAQASQGLPVNNGLVGVVRSIVAGPPPGSSGGGAGGVWLQLRECESSNNYQENSGNGYYGAYQFSEATWSRLGYPGRPDLEPPAMQDQAAIQLQREAGWGQWPACAAALGLI